MTTNRRETDQDRTITRDEADDMPETETAPIEETTRDDTIVPVAEKPASDTPEVADAPTPGPDDAGSTARAGSRTRLVIGGAVALLIAAVVAIGVLTWQWRSTADDLAAARASDHAATQAMSIAKEYTQRSLTYDYNDLDAFFAGVEKGAAPQLVDRYKSVRSTLGGIMSQAQVVATGNVIATSVESRDGEAFVIDVFATQTTRNAQQKEPATVPNLLKVTVADTDSGWQVTDYGAR